MLELIESPNQWLAHEYKESLKARLDTLDLLCVVTVAVEGLFLLVLTLGVF